MISSEQVAALLAAQQQRTAMLQAASSPGGGYQPTSGASAYPPTFSYAQAGPGPGARTAGMVGAAVQAAPMALMAASGAAGLASMFGVQSPLVRGLTSPFVDPFGHGIMQGFSAGKTALMGGQGVFAAGSAGVGAAAPWLLGGAAVGGAAYAGARMLGQGFQDYSGMQGAMSGYQFANAGAPGGRGFSHRDLSGIMSSMRDFDRTDAFTSFGDTQRMLQGFNEMGMGQNVRDAKEISSKLKKMMGAVREIAKMTGTTIDDAMSTYGQMRQSGFFTSQDVMGNAANMQRARGLGISTGAYIGAQQAGASLYRSTGLGGSAGARQMTGNAEALLVSGVATSEQIMDTFDSPDAASGALRFGQKVTSGLANFYQNTAMGRASLMAFGEMRDGKYTGGLDAAVDDMGGMGATDISRRAGARSRSREGTFSFLGNEQNITTAMLGRDDAIVTAVRQIQQTTKNIGGDGAARELIRELMGLSQKESQIVLDLVNTWEQTSRALQAKRVEELRAERLAVTMTRDYSLAGITQKVTGGVSDMLSPVSRAGSSASSAIQQASVSGWNALLGVQANVGGLEREGIRAALGGGARMTSASPGALSRDLLLTDAARSGATTEDTFGFLGDARNSPEVQAEIARLTKDQRFQEQLRAAILSGEDGDRAGLNLTLAREVSGQLKHGTDMRNYILTQAGGGVLAGRNIQDMGVGNSLYKAQAGGSVRDVAAKEAARTNGSIWGASWSGVAEASRAYASLDSTSMQEIMLAISQQGDFGGGKQGDLFSTLKLEQKGSNEEMDAAAVAALNKKYGVEKTAEEWKTVSFLAQRGTPEEFSSFASSIAAAATSQGGYQALEAAKSGGFGGLGRSAVGAGLTSFLETALNGGDATAEYAKLLGSDTTDLSRFSGDPFADRFREQRDSYKKYKARGSGIVKEEELLKMFRAPDMSALSKSLGQAYIDRAGGGITGAEAADLIAQSGSEDMVGLAAAGGTGMSTRANELVVTQMASVADLVARQNLIADKLIQGATDSALAHAAVKDEMLKMKGLDTNGVAGPVGNKME